MRSVWENQMKGEPIVPEGSTSCKDKIGNCHATIEMSAAGKRRFKSFPLQTDDHDLTVCRYAERKALRAGLVKQAEAWRWGSLAQRHGRASATVPLLSAGPLPWPRNWVEHVNRALPEKELESLRRCVERGQPYGGEAWVKRAAGQLGLASTLRPGGRQKKAAKKGT